MSILSKDGYSYQTSVCQARGARLRSEASEYSLGVAPDQGQNPYPQRDLRPHQAAQSASSRRISRLSSGRQNEGMDGYETAAMIRQRDLPILFLTASHRGRGIS